MTCLRMVMAVFRYIFYLKRHKINISDDNSARLTMNLFKQRVQVIKGKFLYQPSIKNYQIIFLFIRSCPPTSSLDVDGSLGIKYMGISAGSSGCKRLDRPKPKKPWV